MEKIAEERIPPQNHKFSPDFEKKLMQKAMQANRKPKMEEKACEIPTFSHIPRKKQAAQRKENDPTVSKHYAFGGMAACILIALTLGTLFHYSDEPELLQSAAIPMEVIDSVQTECTTETTGTTFTKTLNGSANEKTTQTASTSAADRAEMTGSAEIAWYETEQSIPAATTLQQTTVSLQTISTQAGTTVTQTVTASETTSCTTETAETAPPAPVYVLGDVDMDGKITYADAMLVRIDMQLAERGMSEKSFLNDEQRAFGDADGKDSGRYWDGVSYAPEWNAELNDFGQQIRYERYLLNINDYEIIGRVAFLQTFGNERITIQDFLDKQLKYDTMYTAMVQNLKNGDAEKYQKYYDFMQIMKKYSNIQSFESFSDDTDMNVPQYSLKEFWADIEILRTGLV